MYLLNSTLYIFGPCIGHRLDRNRVIPTDHYITDPNLFCLISIQFLHPFKSSVRSVFFTDKGLLASIFHLCQCQHLFIHTVFICAFHHICDISQILLCQIFRFFCRFFKFFVFYMNRKPFVFLSIEYSTGTVTVSASSACVISITPSLLI